MWILNKSWAQRVVDKQILKAGWLVSWKGKLHVQTRERGRERESTRRHLSHLSCLVYFSIVTRHHDLGNLQKEELFGLTV